MARASRRRLESATAGGESPVGGARAGPWAAIASTAAAVEGRRKRGGPPPKAEYLRRPIAEEYREGRVKSTPARGVKEEPETADARAVRGRRP